MKLGLITGLGLLTLAAGALPILLVVFIILSVLGVLSFSFAPFIGIVILMYMLRKMVRKEQERTGRAPGPPIIEATVLPFDPSAYSPPAHFDLMLTAKHDLGRIRGAAAGIEDATLARQFRDLADRADRVLEKVMADPTKLGAARHFFASHLPRSADLAEGAGVLSRQENPDPLRRQKLIDIAHRLAEAVRTTDEGLSAAELQRLDIDLRLLNADLAAPLRDLEPVAVSTAEPQKSRARTKKPASDPAGQA